MEQTLEILEVKNDKNEVDNSSEKSTTNQKTKFDEEWEKAIPAEKVFDDLLIYVRGLWKK
jgi:translation initiation factor 2 alpha subunit (eIF-2alpha)